MKKALRTIIALILILITLAPSASLFSFADTTPNLFCENEAPKDVYYKGGASLSGKKYFATNLCDISGAERVYAGMIDSDRSGAVPFFEFFASDGSFVSEAFVKDSTIEPISRYFGIASAPVPEGATGVRVNFRVSSDISPVVTTEKFTYEEYIQMTGNERKLVRKDSPLYQKKILFCGDSICEAYVEKEDPRYSQIAGWAGRIGTYNDMEFVNKGLGGAAFSYFNPEKNPKYLILTQLKDLESEAESFDLVLLHGGVNDMWDKATIGEISESFDPDDFDMKTFAGALETTFCYAKKTYKNAAIGFLINFQTHSGYGYLGNFRKMQEYWELAKEICKKWEITYLDMFNEQPFKRMRIPTDHGGDGIHPIYEGYEMLYPHIEAFVETLVPLIPTKEDVPPIDEPDDDNDQNPDDDPTDNLDDKPADDPTVDEDKKSALPYIIAGAAVVTAGAAAGAAVVIKKEKKRKKES